MKKASEGIVISVKVTPNASCNEILGWESGELKVRITAVADRGKANEMLIRFLAETWGIRRSQIILTHGHASRHKKICVWGVDPKNLL